MLLLFQLQICDASIGPTVYRYSAYQVVDYLHPFLTAPVQLMIPMPVFTSNLSAFLEPFTFPVTNFVLPSQLLRKEFLMFYFVFFTHIYIYKVWMVLLCVTLTMIAALMLTDHFGWSQKSGNSHIGLHWLFVFGSLFGQGMLFIVNM